MAGRVDNSQVQEPRLVPDKFQKTCMAQLHKVPDRRNIQLRDGRIRGQDLLKEVTERPACGRHSLFFLYDHGGRPDSTPVHPGSGWKIPVNSEPPPETDPAGPIGKWDDVAKLS